MKYRYAVVEQFWESFYDLNPKQKESVRQAWKTFKEDPFDPRLGTHKIHRLSAKYERTIFSIVVESNLRVVFYIEGDLVVTIDVGTHDLYER